MPLEEGVRAPEFELLDQDGKKHKLSDYRGKKIVLYFYPKDDTPKCTIESCNFRDDHTKYGKKNAVILGISLDDEKSHTKFREKYNLPFTLLADTTHEVAKKYEVYGEKKFMGKKYRGINRATFIIDEQGKIMKVFPKVKVEEHSKEILSLL